MAFSLKELSSSQKQKIIKASVWDESCPVSLDRLRNVELLYFNFSKKEKKGRITVLDVVAEEVMMIFKALYEIKFPLSSVKPIEEFGGNDDKSMAENNSSCFNYRVIAGAKLISMHGLGLAIDINPLQNPFVKSDKPKHAGDYDLIKIFPEGGSAYLNRQNLRPGMAENCLHIFKNNGFRVWGGNWCEPIDYHHFQLLRPIGEKIVHSSYAEGRNLFLKYKEDPNFKLNSMEQEALMDPNSYLHM